MLLNILLPLSITLMIEPFVCSLIKKFDFKIFLTSAISNVFLNVGMNLLLLIAKNESYYIILGSFEVATVILEVLIIKLMCQTKTSRTIWLVLAANVASLILGLCINLFAIDIKTILKIIIIIINFLIFALFFVLILLYNRSNKEDESNYQST